MHSFPDREAIGASTGKARSGLSPVGRTIRRQASSTGTGCNREGSGAEDQRPSLHPGDDGKNPRHDKQCPAGDEEG